MFLVPRLAFFEIKDHLKVDQLGHKLLVSRACACSVDCRTTGMYWRLEMSRVQCLAFEAGLLLDTRGWSYENHHQSIIKIASKCSFQGPKHRRFSSFAILCVCFLFVFFWIYLSILIMFEDQRWSTHMSIVLNLGFSCLSCFAGTRRGLPVPWGVQAMSRHCDLGNWDATKC